MHDNKTWVGAGGIILRKLLYASRRKKKTPLLLQCISLQNDLLKRRATSDGTFKIKSDKALEPATYCAAQAPTDVNSKRLRNW